MNCKTCKADCARRGENREKEVCPGFIPMTNADHIRSMTDEELAVWLCELNAGVRCGVCIGSSLCKSGDGRSNGMKKWLKQPHGGG